MNKKIFFLVLLAVFSFDFIKSALAEPPDWAPAQGYRRKHHDDWEEEKYRKEVRSEDRVEYENRKYQERRRRTYKYLYYPEQEVYYYPVTRRYYWKEASGWRVGIRLPGNIRIGASSSFPVELDSDRPYTHHDEIRIKFR